MTLRTRLLVMILLLPLCRGIISAQEMSDTLRMIRQEIDNYMKWHPQIMRTEEDRFKIAPSYGLFYTQEIGLMAMGGFSGTYRGIHDESVPFSNISVSVAISTKLFLMTAIKGTWHSPYINTWAGHLQIRYDASARYMPERFYGIGFNMCDIGAYGEFRNLAFGLRSDILFKFGHFLIGPSFGFDIMNLDKFTGIEIAENYSENYSSFLVGVVLEVDSRDNTASHDKGVFFHSDNTVRPSFDGTTGFRSATTLDFYIPLWKGGCLATDIYGDFSSAEAYWMNWGKFGGDVRMRGYYAGKYRDRNNISAQIELRQWFTPVHGAAAWGGAGTIFPDFASLDFSKLLPTYGIGYRLNLKGMLIRLDVGFGSHGQWSLNMGFNQAF